MRTIRTTCSRASWPIFVMAIAIAFVAAQASLFESTAQSQSPSKLRSSGDKRNASTQPTTAPETGRKSLEATSASPGPQSALRRVPTLTQPAVTTVQYQEPPVPPDYYPEEQDPNTISDQLARRPAAYSDHELANSHGASMYPVEHVQYGQRVDPSRLQGESQQPSIEQQQIYNDAAEVAEAYDPTCTEHGDDCSCSECRRHPWLGMGNFFAGAGDLFEDCFTGLFPSTATHGRSTGHGDPLIATSWLNRPYSFGTFVGAFVPQDVIPGYVQHDASMAIGARLGYDIDYYWGGEMRVGITSPQFRDGRDPPNIRYGDIMFGDFNVLYYPFGDSRWRPFGIFGLGLISYDFDDHQGYPRNETMFTMPFGFGMKYQVTPTLVFRSDIIDTLSFGNKVVGTINDVTFAAGVEWRFGGPRRSYYPWNPSREIP